jgi:iron only hydrogenase large subunit-like protein
MEHNATLPEIIKVDVEKCVNCHLCIGVCPVKYCNNASDPKKGIQINSNLCIACGACIKACTHEARYFVDDTENFFNDLKKGEEIAVLVAPSADTNFPGQLGNLLGWLKNKGVKMNFDVSFGAEISTNQYYKILSSGAKTPVIAQPCPCVVNYIEIYKPELIKYLANTNSPVMDMASWVHKKHPGMKLAFISPCIAKKREFDDPNTHSMVTYNVTISALKKYFRENNVDLSIYNEVSFDGPMEAERGLLYSQPGGLHQTLKRYNLPMKINQVRVTEGVGIYEEFFDELEDEIKRNECDVLVVDILNCSHGCNRGTGTEYHERTTDDVLKLQAERLEMHTEEYYSNQERLKRLEDFLESMNDIDFTRKYTDRSEFYSALEEPTEEITDIINEQMGKFSRKDIKNCGACGYNSCKKMTKAVLNNLYRPQQCHHFLESFYNANAEDMF